MSACICTLVVCVCVCVHVYIILKKYRKPKHIPSKFPYIYVRILTCIRTQERIYFVHTHSAYVDKKTPQYIHTCVHTCIHKYIPAYTGTYFVHIYGAQVDKKTPQKFALVVTGDSLTSNGECELKVCPGACRGNGVCRCV